MDLFVGHRSEATLEDLSACQRRPVRPCFVAGVWRQMNGWRHMQLVTLIHKLNVVVMPIIYTPMAINIKEIIFVGGWQKWVDHNQRNGC